MNKPLAAPQQRLDRVVPRLPNLIVIGAMKCGTSSLHEYLNLHPDIFMSRVKEVDFFYGDQGYEKGNWDRGLDWYRKQFVTDRKIRGESSQNYSKAHLITEVPERMHSVVPGAKLIYLVRDPIERLISHFWENVEGGEEPKGDLNAFLAKCEGNHYVETSRYFMQLEAYLKYFRRDQILVIDCDALRTNRLATMNRIFGFLGVPAVENGEIFQFQVNSRDSKRIPTLAARLATGRALAPVRALIPVGFRERIKEARLFYRKAARREIDPEVATRIRACLRPDVEALREFSGESFESWSL